MDQQQSSERSLRAREPPSLPAPGSDAPQAAPTVGFVLGLAAIDTRPSNRTGTGGYKDLARGTRALPGASRALAGVLRAVAVPACTSFRRCQALCLMLAAACSSLSARFQALTPANSCCL